MPKGPVSTWCESRSTLRLGRALSVRMCLWSGIAERFCKNQIKWTEARDGSRPGLAEFDPAGKLSRGRVPLVDVRD